MGKNKDYKIIQIGFSTKKEYESYHNDAVKFHGKDNRFADVAYARECFKNNKKIKKASTKEKAIALVEEQTALTELIRRTNETDMKSNMITVSKEAVRLWGH